MTTYECLYCGVTYHRMAEMRSCDICGQPIGPGWFREVRRAEPIPINRTVRGKKAVLQKTA